MKKDKITFDDIFEKGLEEKIDSVNEKLGKIIKLINNINPDCKSNFAPGGILFNEKQNYKFREKVNEILNKKIETEIRTTEGLTTTFKDGVITISGKLDDGDIIQVDFDKMETRKICKEVKVNMNSRNVSELEFSLKNLEVSALKFNIKQLEIEVEQLKNPNKGTIEFGDYVEGICKESGNKVKCIYLENKIITETEQTWFYNCEPFRPLRKLNAEEIDKIDSSLYENGFIFVKKHLELVKFNK